MAKSKLFVDIGNTMSVNVQVITKVVRNLKREYVMVTRDNEKYVIKTETALFLIRLGIPYYE